MRFLLRRLSGWPLWLLHALGSGLGWLAYLLSGTYRRRLREHARQAGIAPATRRAAVAEAGRMVAELPRVWLCERLRDPVRWQGAELLEALLAQPRGLVLLTPHLGSFEVAARAYAERYGAERPLTVLYRPARQAWLREIELQARERPGMSTAPATLAGVRRMRRALERGEAVGLLPDQVPPEGLGAWAPFFGRDAYTMTLAARLVQHSGAALGMLWAERLAGGRGWLVHAESCPPLPPAQAGEVTATTAINAMMEEVIRRCPGQYLWGYHRYKSPRRAPP